MDADRPVVTVNEHCHFADKSEAKRGALLIDTVFEIGAVHVWRGGRPPNLEAILTRSQQDRVYARHLRFGAPPASEHTGLYTYSARMLEVFGRRGSFIPLGTTGERISISFSEFCHGLAQRLGSGLKGRLPPIILSDQEVADILDLTWSRTTHAVTNVHELGVSAACGSLATAAGRHLLAAVSLDDVLHHSATEP